MQNTPPQTFSPAPATKEVNRLQSIFSNPWIWLIMAVIIIAIVIIIVLAVIYSPQPKSSSAYSLRNF